MFSSLLSSFDSFTSFDGNSIDLSLSLPSVASLDPHAPPGLEDSSSLNTASLLHLPTTPSSSPTRPTTTWRSHTRRPPPLTLTLSHSFPLPPPPKPKPPPIIMAIHVAPPLPSWDLFSPHLTRTQVNGEEHAHPEGLCNSCYPRTEDGRVDVNNGWYKLEVREGEKLSDFASHKLKHHGISPRTGLALLPFLIARPTPLWSGDLHGLGSKDGLCSVCLKWVPSAVVYHLLPTHERVIELGFEWIGDPLAKFSRYFLHAFDCHPASLAEVRLSSTLLRKRTHAGMSGRKSTSTDLDTTATTESKEEESFPRPPLKRARTTSGEADKCPPESTCCDDDEMRIGKRRRTESNTNEIPSPKRRRFDLTVRETPLEPVELPTFALYPPFGDLDALLLDYGLLAYPSPPLQNACVNPRVLTSAAPTCRPLDLYCPPRSTSNHTTLPPTPPSSDPDSPVHPHSSQRSSSSVKRRRTTRVRRTLPAVSELSEEEEESNAFEDDDDDETFEPGKERTTATSRRGSVKRRKTSR